MEDFMGAVGGPIARDQFGREFIVIGDGCIKQEVVERLLGL
jgi:hypothetical protein